MDNMMPKFLICDQIPEGTIMFICPHYKTVPSGEPLKTETVLDLGATARGSFVMYNVGIDKGGEDETK